MDLKILVYFILYMCSDICLAKSLSILQVPHTAKQGFVITILSPSSHINSIKYDSSSEEKLPTDLFSIQDHGVLTVSKNISYLKNQLLTVHVLSDDYERDVKVLISDDSHVFIDSPYHAIIESYKSGTVSTDMESFTDTIETYNLQNIQIVFGRTDLFELRFMDGILYIVSRKSLSGEQEQEFKLLVKATEPSAHSEVYTYVILKVQAENKLPRFNQPAYHFVLNKADVTTKPVAFVTVEYFQDDLKFRTPNNDIFYVNENTGEIYVKYEENLEVKSYEIPLFMENSSGTRLAVAMVNIEVFDPEDEILQMDNHMRRKRATLDQRVFVIRTDQTGNLFSVSTHADQRFAFKGTAPAQYDLTELGMVSLKSAMAPAVANFIINRTNVNDPNAQDDLPVKVEVVTRGVNTPIFKNEPRPLVAVVQRWMYPRTPVFTFNAVDQEDYKAQVEYKIESGADGRFMLDPATGVLTTLGRQPFDKNFSLAVSANNVGAVQSAFTRTQELSIFSTDRGPQFYESPMVWNMPESQADGDYKLVQTKSFFDLAIRYTMALEYSVPNRQGIFSVHQDTGMVSLARKLRWESDPRQYRFIVTATEEHSNFVTQALLIINLEDVNDHSPMFAPTVYTARDIKENVAVGTSIVQIAATDIDAGSNAYLSFNLTGEGADLFKVDAADIQRNIAGKTGLTTATIKVQRALDYDDLLDHMYEFQVLAIDGGSPAMTGTAIVKVHMSNVNDNRPEMVPSSQEVTLNEEATAGTVVHILQAFDRDGDSITYAFQGNAPGTLFNLDQNSGHITLSRKPPNGTDRYDLNFTITDGENCCGLDSTRVYPGAPSGTGVVSISLTGVNRPPRFETCQNYKNITIMENRPRGTPVINVTATDNDPGVNGLLVYGMVYRHNEEKRFEIRTLEQLKKGEVSSLQMFDRENSDGLTKIGVTVSATDHGKPRLSALCFFFISIGDENDNSPRFDEQKYEFTIPQNIAQHASVIQVFAVDDDEGENAEVVYSIESQESKCSGSSTCFGIHANTGWITFTGNMQADFTGVIKLVVKGEDKGSPPNNNTVEVEITVVETNAVLPPEWQRQMSVKIKENVEINTVINALPIKATSRPTGVKVNYAEIYEGRTKLENKERIFRRSLNDTDNSMSIFVQKTLDYETTPSYSLKLRVLNAEGKEPPSNYMRYNVTLEDVNDNIPIFVGQDATSRYPAAVTEASPVGTTVVFVSAIDDDGTPPNNVVTYEKDTTKGDHEFFKLDPTSGLVTTDRLFTKEHIGQEKFLYVIAKDGIKSDRPGHTPPNTPNSAQATVKVQVTGLSVDPPYFHNSSMATVTFEEDQVFNTTVAVVTAINPEPELNILQYGIMTGSDRNFGVDFSSGRIFSMGRALFNKKMKYELMYRVFDGYVNRTTTVTINLRSRNRIEPRFGQLEYVSVATVTEENKPDSALTVSTVNATDPDQRCTDNNIQYNITGNLVSYRGTTRFQLSGKDIQLIEALDRDYPYGHGSWWINAEATDEVSCTVDNQRSRKGYSLVRVDPVDINDNAPMLDVSKLVGSVDEGSGSDVEVMRVKAIDYDDGNNAKVSFTNISHLKPALGSPLFKITTNPNNEGVINTLGSNQLNRAERDQYIMIVTMEDQGSPKSTAYETITINIADINNNRPVFETLQYTKTIPEEMAIGDYVTDVLATDADINENAFRDYSIVDTDGENFKMDSLRSTGAGAIKINKRVDYETITKTVFTFQVLVKHPTQAGHSATATVTVTVTDINDNAPVFSSTSENITISEGSNIGHTVTTVTATDADKTSPNKDFSFMIDYENTDPDKKFAVDPTSGVVTLRNKLDRETQEYHTVHVLAVDQGTPAMTGTMTLYVTVGDINDNAPEFRQSYDFSVGPSTGQNTEIGRFMAMDRDTAVNGPPFAFDLGCTTGPDCPFTLEVIPGSGTEATGVLKTSLSSYPRSKGRNYYDIPIKMKDNPTSGEQAQEQNRIIRILVQGSSNEAQQNGNKQITVYNHNGNLGRVMLGHAYTEDPQDWVPQNREFTLENKLHSEYFQVESNGTIYMKQGAPKGEMSIEIRAVDQRSTATATVSVNNIWIMDEAVYSAGSMRISGTTAKKFVERPSVDSSYGDSIYTKFRAKLADVLLIPVENVHIFTVMDVQNEQNMVDLVYAAHNSPYYRPAKLNGVAWEKKSQLEIEGVSVVMTPINPCKMKTCWNSGCMNEYTVNSDGHLVNTNATALLGVNAFVEASCKCGSTDYSKALSCDPNPCKNQGICSPSDFSGFTCTCPDGFHGSRCEMTHASFEGSGWGWVEAFDQCEQSTISLEFITKQSNGLLLYYGPMYEPQGNDPRGFLSLELAAGFPKMSVSLGFGILTWTMDGKNKQNQQKLAALNDGKWHKLEIYKMGKDFKLVVDRCKVSEITEDIESSTVDDVACSVQGSAPGDNFLLNVESPVVQVGGRSKVTQYPGAVVTTTGFNGCIKNLRHNGELYDLNMTNLQSSNAESQCPRELTSCDGKCSGNSSCIGDFDGGFACQCLPGFMGQNCDQELKNILDTTSTTRRKRQTDETTDWSFAANSFIEWKFKDSFYQQLSGRQNVISATYRTRQLDGMLFMASSQNRMEHIKVELMNGIVQVRYDLGADDRVLQLSGVNGSDGQWHMVIIKREANLLSVSMDSGEGRFYAQSLPSDNFRIIELGQSEVFGGADVTFQKYSNRPILQSDYKDSCMAEVKVNDGVFPWDQSQDSSSPAATVTTKSQLNADCLSNACASVNCQPPTMCKDLWRHAVCVCPANETLTAPAVCSPIMDCSIEQCVNGYCVMFENRFRCHCDYMWMGERCDIPSDVGVAPYAGLSTGGAVSIAVCLLVLLLLILLVICIVRRQQNKADKYYEPENDIRDNIVYYDEEGAGEEDYHAYDLTGLRKPVNPDDIDSVANMAPYRPPVSREQMPLDMSAAPMTDRPPIAPGGKIPHNIGDFIGDRMYDANNDPQAPPYDSIREYDFEGGGSSVGSLSSLNTSSSGDLEFDYLNDYGPKFRKLADMYGGGDNEEESNV